MVLSSKYRRIRNNRARISGLQLCFSAPRISLSSPRALNTETYKALNHKPLSLSEMKEDANCQFFLSFTQSRSQSLRYYIQAKISAPETIQSHILLARKVVNVCLESVYVADWGEKFTCPPLPSDIERKWKVLVVVRIVVADCCVLQWCFGVVLSL